MVFDRIQLVLIDVLKNIFQDIKYFYKHSYHDLQKYTVRFPLLELVFHVNVFYAYNKDFYKGKKGSKKSSKYRKSKVYKA